MITNRDDDYLICKHYYNNIDKVSEDYKDFITFEHSNNHYFAWVHDGKVILRSEAYPDLERTVRGIKAIIKNRNIEDRYTIDSQHGVHFLCLWGGGKNNKHTGNMNEHNEIGRSCPTKNKEDLYNLIKFNKGDNFASTVTGFKSSKKVATAIAASAVAAPPLASKKSTISPTVTQTAATTLAKDDESAGFKWWWLLLPLLLIAAFFLFKGCGGNKAKTTEPVKAKTEVIVPAANVEKNPKTDLDANTNVAVKAMQAKAKEEIDAKIATDRISADAQAKADKVKAETAAAKAKADADRKAKTGGSVSQENIRIGNKNSGF